MSAHVLLNLSNELGNRDKMQGWPSILSLYHKLVYSIMQEHECLILFIIRRKSYFVITFLI